MSSHSRNRGLPVVRISGVRYLLDVRLRQFRQVDNPSDVIDLDGDGSIEVEPDDDTVC